MQFVKEIKIDNITRNEKDWLIGLFLADGSKYKNVRTYTVSFYLNSVKDSKIFERLKSILEKLGAKYGTYLERRNTLNLRVQCKKFFELMPNKDEIYDVGSESPEAFIAGFLDGDGYISKKYGCVGFSQTIIKWIGPFISNYLMFKGIKPWKNLIYRNCFYYTASLKKVREKTNIINFMAKSNYIA